MKNKGIDIWMNECLKHLAQKEKLLEENYALQMKPDMQHNSEGSVS